MKPVGGPLELEVGQSQQAAINDQNDDAQTERSADPSAVERGNLVEANVKTSEEPPQPGIHRPNDEQTGQGADQGRG